MGYLHMDALQSHGMVHDGSLEDMEQISSRILPMESHGLRPVLGMAYLQVCATQSHRHAFFRQLQLIILV
jgi:hypothetical protein